jgi:hypothetical protein
MSEAAKIGIATKGHQDHKKDLTGSSVKDRAWILCRGQSLILASVSFRPSDFGFALLPDGCVQLLLQLLDYLLLRGINLSVG